MKHRALSIFAAALLICLIPAASVADIVPYSQDFEAMDLPFPGSTALADDGWVVYGNVYDSEGIWQYGYGTEPAPNDGAAFCAVVLGEGGVEQGAQQLSVYSDYNNLDHGAGLTIEANVFQEMTIGEANVGETWVFEFQAKLGNIAGSSTAAAFIKTIDPDNGFAQTNLVTVDMTSIPVEWGGYSVLLDIIPELVGQYFQFGFLNTATNFESSAIIYDNAVLRLGAPVGVPESSLALGATLAQNYPNPFNPMTQVDFTLEKAGNVEVSVYDLGGRRVATLHHGELDAGQHSVTWNGRTDSGAAVAAGQYRYVLKTATSQVARSMVLVK